MSTGQKSSYEYHLRYRETTSEDDKEKHRQYGVEYYIIHRKSKKPYKPRKKRDEASKLE